MLYLWAKALHLTAVIVWVGGMLLVPSLLKILPNQSPALPAIAKAYGRLTNPAVLFGWILGIYLVVDGGFYMAGWFHAKILLFLFLSAGHGILSAHLRKRANDPNYHPSGFVGNLHWFTLIAVLLTAVLAIVKPF